jgi:hypothetical protein
MTRKASANLGICGNIGTPHRFLSLADDPTRPQSPIGLSGANQVACSASDADAVAPGSEAGALRRTPVHLTATPASEVCASWE